jgi:hypothetical protein
MASIIFSAVQSLAFPAPTSAEVDATTDGVMCVLKGLPKAPGLKAVSKGRVIQGVPSAVLFRPAWVLQKMGLAKHACLVTINKTARWDFESMRKAMQLRFEASVPLPSILHWAPSQETKRSRIRRPLHLGQ